MFREPEPIYVDLQARERARHEEFLERERKRKAEIAENKRWQNMSQEQREQHLAAIRARHDAQVAEEAEAKEAERAAAREAAIDEAMAPYFQREMRRYLAEHPDHSKGYFERKVWPRRKLVLADELAEEGLDAYKQRVRARSGLEL